MRSMAPTDGRTAEAIEGVHLTQLVAGDRLSVQHFHIEPGATVPEHYHDHEQGGFVTDGTLTFHVDDEERTVAAGDTYVIPGGEPHSAQNRGDVPVDGIDVFAPPRTDPPWRE